MLKNILKWLETILETHVKRLQTHVFQAPVVFSDIVSPICLPNPVTPSLQLSLFHFNFPFFSFLLSLFHFQLSPFFTFISFDLIFLFSFWLNFLVFVFTVSDFVVSTFSGHFPASQMVNFQGEDHYGKLAVAAGWGMWVSPQYGCQANTLLKETDWVCWTDSFLDFPKYLAPIE